MRLTVADLLDVWNEDCNIHDQVNNTCEDMGLTKADLANACGPDSPPSVFETVAGRMAANRFGR